MSIKPDFIWESINLPCIWKSCRSLGLLISWSSTSILVSACMRCCTEISFLLISYSVSQFFGIGEAAYSPVFLKKGISRSIFLSELNGLKSGLNEIVGATISSNGFSDTKLSILLSLSKSKLGVILYLPNERFTAERIMA